MLLLTRSQNQTIRIGEEISVTVLSHHGNQVRLAIHAPDSVQILREELLNRPPRERKPAQGGDTGDVMSKAETNAEEQTAIETSSPVPGVDAPWPYPVNAAAEKPARTPRIQVKRRRLPKGISGG